MHMTEIEKYIINLRYVLRMLEDNSFSREEITEELKKELNRTINIQKNNA